MLVLSCWYCHVGIVMLVLSCWYCHVGIVMLVLSCWYCHVGIVMLVLSCWYCMSCWYCWYIQIITSSNFSLNEQTSKELMEMAHQGLKLLTGWTTAVMELVRERRRGRGEEGAILSVLFF